MGYLYGVVAIILFGLNGPVAKVVMLGGATPIQLSFMREVITFALAAIALLIFDRRGFRLSRKQILGMLAVGVFGVAGLQLAFAIAIKNLPVGIALLFEYCGVVLVSVFATVIFKEPSRPRLWVGLGLVVVGLVVVANIGNGSLNPIGIIAGAAAAITLATYFLLGERMLVNASVMSVLFWSMLIGAAIWCIPAAPWSFDWSLMAEVHSLGGALSDVFVPLWIPTIWSGVLGTFTPYVFSYLAIKHLKATPAGILSTGEVAFSFLFGWLWLQEVLTFTQLIGVSLVVVGIIAAQTARKQQHPADLTFASAELAPTSSEHRL